jgi:hypothetical protein
MIESAKEADLTFRVNVTFEAGAPFTDLTDATFRAFATDGYVTTEATETAIDGTTLGVTFARDTLPRGSHRGKVLATKSAVTQCVATFDLLIF